MKQSKPQQGSTFVFTIRNQTLSQEQQPLDFLRKEETELDIVKPAHKIVDLEHPLDSVKILLVDDSPDNRILVSRVLKLAGAQVISAQNGDEGVKAAMADSYDIILMDLQMPVKDGYEATAELRKLAYKKPIIALTAHVMKGDREKCLRSGFNDHVGKPIDRNLLISAITNLVH